MPETVVDLLRDLLGVHIPRKCLHGLEVVEDIQVTLKALLMGPASSGDEADKLAGNRLDRILPLPIRKRVSRKFRVDPRMMASNQTHGLER